MYGVRTVGMKLYLSYTARGIANDSGIVRLVLFGTRRIATKCRGRLAHRSARTQIQLQVGCCARLECNVTACNSELNYGLISSSFYVKFVYIRYIYSLL